MMARQLLSVALLGMAAAAGAAPSVSTYRPSAGDATVKLVGLGTPSMCVGAVQYKLQVVERNGARSFQVPAGSKVDLANALELGEGSCGSALSFTPTTGNTYVIHSGVAIQQCYSELVREDRLQASGIAVETSLGQSACQPVK